jgi:hypothetical protein
LTVEDFVWLPRLKTVGGNGAFYIRLLTGALRKQLRLGDFARQVVLNAPP